jgi:hypothetical protein
MLETPPLLPPPPLLLPPLLLLLLPTCSGTNRSSATPLD